MKKKLLPLILLILAGLQFAQAQAYDFSAVAPTGQTLYYHITDSINNKVCVTSPALRWFGFTKPSGDLSIPESVNHNGVTYLVTGIGAEPNWNNGAFQTCSGLTSVSIPNSVTFIGNFAFSSCIGLTSVTIPNSVTWIGEEAFSYVSMIYYSGTANLPLELTGALCINGYIEDSLYYTSIRKDTLCAAHRQIVNAVIPNSVKIIRAGAFYACSRLSSFSIPDSVSTIGYRTFRGCKSLTLISITNSITSIEKEAFYNCGITELVIPPSVSFIGRDAFSQNPLKKITLNSNKCKCNRDGHLVDFRYSEIAGNSPLETVIIGENVDTVRAYSFSDCSSLSKLVLSNSTSVLENNAFWNCDELDTIIINSSVEFNNAFENCDSISTLYYNVPQLNSMEINSYKRIFSNINSLHIGNDVITIPYTLFEKKQLLNTIYLDPDSNQITSIGVNAFNGCNNMAGHIVVPHITSLGDGAFSGCSMISSVELGNGLSAIGDTVFKGCDHMTNVTLGRGVQSIADNAFEGCTEIRLLTSRALNPPTIYRTTFEDVDDDISVRVPCEAVAAYQNAPFWSHFNNIEGRFDFFFSATSADITKGSVTIVHAPVCDNIEAHIQANPYHGYRFSHWSDGNTDNPRYILVTQDTIITANFEENVGIDSPLLHPTHYSQEGNRLVVNGAEGEHVRVFDIMGRLIYSQSSVPEAYSITLPAAGVYLIQIGNSTPQKIVVY